MSLPVILSAVCLLVGAAWVAIAALGLVRLPDLYLRMHSMAKAGTLGCGFILIGVALAQPELGVCASRRSGRSSSSSSRPPWRRI